MKSEGRIRDYDGYDVGLFTSDLDNNRDVVSLMSGQLPCSAYTRPQSYMGFVYREKGVNFMCRMSVPPDPSKFIGQISVGWKIQPDEEAARIVMRIASGMLWGP